MNYTTETMVIAVAAFLALLGAAFAHDHLFAVHMGILCFCLAVGLLCWLGTLIFRRQANGGKSIYQAISTR